MGKKGSGGGGKSGGAKAAKAAGAATSSGVLAGGAGVCAAVSAVALGLLLRSGALRGPTSADTAALEGLIALSANGGDFTSLLGSVAAPSAVPRVQWDPNEPLAPWLGRLHV